MRVGESPLFCWWDVSPGRAPHPKYPTCRYPSEMAVDVDKIRAMAERVVASEGLVLVDVEVKGGSSNQLLRIYIDKPDGVSHADCQAVSEQMSTWLDVEDLFPGRYLLEVSSPGLDRQLVKPSDYAYFTGRRARLVLRQPLDDQVVLEGTLAGFVSGRVRLDLGGGEVRELELARISKARLVVER
jgi:ribosome maturation factor RimP